MKEISIKRRQCLLGACGLGLGAALNVLAEPPEKKETPEVQPITNEPFPRNAEEALQRLQAGNQRFMNDNPLHNHRGFTWRSSLVEMQKPFATILGCSDSRVPPELVFDVGFGDLFTIRIAGNIIEEDVIGSMQYAVRHLRTPLVIVLGHEKCGAVAAAVDELVHKPTEPEHIGSLIKSIKPGLKKLDLTMDREKLISDAVEANVHWSMQQLRALPAAQPVLREGRVTLMGGIYELHTGRVRFI